MNINELFPSKYLKADDLKGAARQVTVASVAVEEVAQGEQKPVVRFSEVDKGLVLNKTNAMLLAAMFGTDTTGWSRKSIELYAEPVSFQGRIVNALRVRALPPPVAPPTSAPDPDEHSELNW